MINEAVPNSVVELIRCSCKKGCKNNLCCCRKANLSCTDACLCNDSNVGTTKIWMTVMKKKNFEMFLLINCVYLNTS